MFGKEDTPRATHSSATLHPLFVGVRSHVGVGREEAHDGTLVLRVRHAGEHNPEGEEDQADGADSTANTHEDGLHIVCKERGKRGRDIDERRLS